VLKAKHIVHCASCIHTYLTFLQFFHELTIKEWQGMGSERAEGEQSPELSRAKLHEIFLLAGECYRDKYQDRTAFHKIRKAQDIVHKCRWIYLKECIYSI
jgi:hypothetical protein